MTSDDEFLAETRALLDRSRSNTLWSKAEAVPRLLAMVDERDILLRACKDALNAYTEGEPDDDA